MTIQWFDRSVYYKDEYITLHCMNAMHCLHHFTEIDAVITDPPYGETDLVWDKWPQGWPKLLLNNVTSNLWCFGTLRMFMERVRDFDGWTLAQDVIWEKHNGTNTLNDRFRRIHEHVAHFYPSNIKWKSIYKSPQFTMDATKKTARRKRRPGHWSKIEGGFYRSEDGGPRLVESIIYAQSCHGHAIHPTQKPEAIIRPLILYSVPEGGTVLDPFAGSGTTLVVARAEKRKAIGIEAREDYCKKIVERLSQGILV